MAVAWVSLICPAFVLAAGAGVASSPPGGAKLERGEHRHRIDRAPAQVKVPETLLRHLPRRPFPPAPRDLDDAATAEGRWAAENVARGPGRRTFYRAGFYDGTHLAIERLPLFPEERAQGLRDGGRDPAALAYGQEAGSAAAGEAARHEAGVRVERQFMDLSTEPLFDDHPSPWPCNPSVPGMEAPPLEESFRALAADHVPGLSATWNDAFALWRLDPWGLHQCGGYGDFVDERWADPAAAFDLWLEAPRRAAAYRKLQLPADKQRFRDVFEAAYASRLVMLYDEELAVSYQIGHGDGWTWGAVAVAEWRYATGYAEGFDQAARTAAAAACGALYPGAYRDHYRERFDDWSRSSVPGLTSFRIQDGSDDGVFQPGEALLAWLELANYGGAPGKWTVAIAGVLLESGADIGLEVPARRAVSPDAPVELRLRPDVERGRQSAITATLEESRREAPLTISYPLTLTGAVRLTALDVPAGRAVAEVEVRNESRRAVGGDLEAIPVTPLAASPVRARLEALRPGETRAAAFSLEGVDPLAALSGDVEVRFELTSGATRHDAMVWSFPPLAEDLASGELERFLVALAKDREASGEAVRAAIGLALRRVAADWAAVVGREGNPYKHDLEERAGTTALGALVRAYHRERARLSNREVFERLGEGIEGMAEDLPGVHPLLREYLVRLARQLG